MQVTNVEYREGLIGETVGVLLVIGPIVKGRPGEFSVTCECRACGESCSVDGHDLMSGKNLYRERCIRCPFARAKKIQVGQLFGNWTVQDVAKRGEDGRIAIPCKCKCGTLQDLRLSDIDRGARCCQVCFRGIQKTIRLLSAREEVSLALAKAEARASRTRNACQALESLPRPLRPPVRSVS